MVRVLSLVPDVGLSIVLYTTLNLAVLLMVSIRPRTLIFESPRRYGIYLFILYPNLYSAARTT